MAIIRVCDICFKPIDVGARLESAEIIIRGASERPMPTVLEVHQECAQKVIDSISTMIKEQRQDTIDISEIFVKEEKNEH